MLIVENKVYLLSENPTFSDFAHNTFYPGLKETPLIFLFNILKSSNIKNIVGLIFVKNTIYLAAKGMSEVRILRDNVSATLIKNSGMNIITASGFPKDGDKILLQTNNNINDTLELDFKESNKELIFHQENFVYTLKNTARHFLNILPKRSIYLKENIQDEVSPKSKKLTFLVAIILLILLGVSIGFGIRQKKINDLKNKYNGILKEALYGVDQAISLASVDITRSRQLFTESEQKVAQIEKLNVKDSDLTSLKQKINESRAAILGEYLVKPEMFLDLSLLSSGFKGDIINLSGEQLYVLDTAGKKIIGVNIATKKSRVVAGPTIINSALGLACYGERVFILGSDGIYEVDSGSQKLISKFWSGDVLIATFASNLYVMDKSGNIIYRIPGINNSFGEKQNWLAAGTNVNFANVSQIAVDGSIYALYPNSKILKFSQGSPINFNIKGIVPEIGNVNAIGAGPDNTNIYLLDKAGGRVVATDKKGNYLAQYVDSVISQATGLVVSENDKKIILLVGDKLYSIDIKNI